jgi:predicted nucleotidyltransferase
MSAIATSAGLDALPPEARVPLQALKDDLEKAVGPNLAALVVYGSAARGGYVPGESDLDVIVVLEDTALAQLEKVAEPLMRARFRARVEAMVLKRREIASAADVFPLLYDDVRQRHVLLAGADPFSALEISDAHRRLRIEQELREARMRTRRAVVDALGSDPALAGAVARKVKQIRGPLHALLCLKRIECDDRLEPVLAAAGKAYGVDTAPLLRVRAEPRAAHAALRALLDAAVDDADTIHGGGRA